MMMPSVRLNNISCHLADQIDEVEEELENVKKDYKELNNKKNKDINILQTKIK